MTESASPHDDKAEHAQQAHSALFVDDRELRRRINPKMGWDSFRAAVRTAELDGFPTIHKLWGGRYWPSVVAWLDARMGVKNDGFANAEDGPESFDAPTRPVSRAQTRTPQFAVLDRSKRRAG
jgi:hypothetical protein